MAGLTQNQNEGFNATIWRRCPKERAFDASAVKRAVCLATISWNSGRSCYQEILTALGLSSNYFTSKIAHAKDYKRISEVEKYDKKKESIKRKVQEKNQIEIIA